MLAVLLAVLGGIMSALTVERRFFKWGSIALFALLGLGSVILIVLQAQQTRADQDAATARQTQLQKSLDETKLESAKAVSFLNGRLDMLTSLIAHPPANPDLQNLAHVLQEGNRRAAMSVSNAELRLNAFDLARRLRDLQSRFTAEQSQLNAYRMEQFRRFDPRDRSDATTRELNRISDEYGRAVMDLYSRQTGEFGPLRSEAMVMRDQLLGRLSAQPRDTGVEMVLDRGALAGPNPIGDLATYIEKLARSLPER